MKKLAAIIERDHSEAAVSSREGLKETFTINRHDVPPPASPSGDCQRDREPHSVVRKKTSNVCRWRDGDLILRWVAGAFILTERNFRRIMGYRDLWALAGILGRATKNHYL